MLLFLFVKNTLTYAVCLNTNVLFFISLGTLEKIAKLLLLARMVPSLPGAMEKSWCILY